MAAAAGPCTPVCDRRRGLRRNNVISALAAGDDPFGEGPRQLQKDTTAHRSQPKAIASSSFTPANITCSGYDNGSVTLAASGGRRHTVSPSARKYDEYSGVFTGLVPGTYSVEVDDSQGCDPVVSEAVEITNCCCRHRFRPDGSILSPAITMPASGSSQRADSTLPVFNDDEATYNASNDFAG